MAMSSVLGRVIDGGAGQALASLERTIVLANEVWLPCRGGSICFH